MYETFMTVVRTFFGSGLYFTALKYAVPIVLLALIALSSPAFRTFVRSWRDRGGWRSVFIALPTAGIKLLMLFIIMRLIVVALVWQSEQFEHQHGNVTEANRSAVLMKWGYPHEQRELSVSFTTKRTWVTRQLLIPAPELTSQEIKDGQARRKDTINREEFWKDEEPPILPVDDMMPKVLSVREEERDVPVAQKAIDSADVKIGLTPDERQLGGANYTGYRDAWDLRYVIVNRLNKPVSAHMNFPLPSKTGILNNLKVTVDGATVFDRATTSEDGISWTSPMAPETKAAVAISFSARGLEYLRYIPRRMTQTGHYRVSAAFAGNLDPRKLDWCIGSMPADQKLDEVTGSPYTLTWTLDDALTSYDVGIRLPEAVQPNYHVARLLREAPIGLLLLLTLLVAPRIIAGRAVDVSLLALIAAGYYLLYTFMGQFADVLPNFAASFAVAVVVLTGVVATLRLRDGSCRFLAWQDTAAFLALAYLYPLAVIDADRTAFWMQLFYVAALLYVCVLVVRFRVLPVIEARVND